MTAGEMHYEMKFSVQLQKIDGNMPTIKKINKNKSYKTVDKQNEKKLREFVHFGVYRLTKMSIKSELFYS